MAFWFWFGLVLAVLAALAVLLTAISLVRIRIRYSHSGKHDQLIVLVRALYGIYHYRAIIPGVIIRGWNIIFENKSSHHFAGTTSLNMPKVLTGSEVLKKWKNVQPLVRTSLPVMRAALKKMECTRYRHDFRIGTGDAPSTAVLCGLLWTVYGCAIAMMSRWVRLNTKPYGEVVPVYKSPEFSMVWEADFQFRVGPMLAAVMKAGVRKVPLGKIMKQMKQLRSLAENPQSV